MFATADSEGKGRWLEGPQAWHGDLMPTRLEALGLGDLYTVKFAGGADAIWAELASAKKEGRGIITFNWTPNFTDAEGFAFIEFPPYTDGCRVADGGDGSCGSPKGWLKKAANFKFPNWAILGKGCCQLRIGEHPFLRASPLNEFPRQSIHP